jgi:hypothetical protein
LGGTHIERRQESRRTEFYSASVFSIWA